MSRWTIHIQPPHTFIHTNKRHNSLPHKAHNSYSIHTISPSHHSTDTLHPFITSPHQPSKSPQPSHPSIIMDTTTKPTKPAFTKKNYNKDKKPFTKKPYNKDSGSNNKKRSYNSASSEQRKPYKGGASSFSSSSSAGGPANKKRNIKFERAQGKPAFDLVTRAKTIWATFRSKRLDKEEREKLSEELFGLIKGKLHQIAVKHDAARVVQCALLHGNKEQRELYTTELLEYLLEFSKINYAHFIILRLLDVTVAQPSERKRILRVFAGKGHTLATHAVGAKVLEGIFSTYPKQDTQALRAELYGRETTLLLGGVTGGVAPAEAPARDLKAILAELPERREKVLANVSTMIQKMLVKDLVSLPFVQELIWEYFVNAGPLGIREMVPTLMDYLLLLTGTRPGCKVLAECAAYGTPKDRKKMLKALKGYVLPTLLHKDAYLFLLRLSDVVDDTVTFTKAIWNELLEKNETEGSMLRFATHVKASKILLLLLAPGKRTTFLTKDELELLKPAFIPFVEEKEKKEKEEEGEGEKDTEEKKEKEKPAAKKAATTTTNNNKNDAPVMVPTSKKDADIRREELLAPLKDALIQLGKTHSHEMLVSAEGSFTLYEVATRWRDPALLEAIAKAAAAEAPAEVEVEEEEEEKEEEEKEEDDGEEGEEGEEEGDDEVAAMEIDTPNKKPAATKEEEEEDAGPVREHRIAYKTIKRLLLFELGPKPGNSPKTAAAPETPKPLFAEALYREAKGTWVEKWLSSIRGGFIVEALVKIPLVGPQVMKELGSQEAEIKELAVTMKGAAAVLNMMKNGVAAGGSGPPKKGAGAGAGGNKKAGAAGGGAKGGKGGKQGKK